MKNGQLQQPQPDKEKTAVWVSPPGKPHREVPVLSEQKGNVEWVVGDDQSLPLDQVQE